MNGGDVDAYLKRINYDGPRAPSAQTLSGLHQAHMLSVPFENLSIHRDEPIVLDRDSLFDKIVRRRRGGFCYELNGLFGSLLNALGFDVTLLAAGVSNRQGEYGPPFDHMALLVTLEERRLADVGFGDSFRRPLLLDERGTQPQADADYRIDVAEGEHLIMLQRKRQGAWQPQYRFDLQGHTFDEYRPMCRYHQTSPNSHFTQQEVCSLATADGRVTLSDSTLIITRNGERQEQALADADAVRAARLRYFGFA